MDELDQFEGYVAGLVMKLEPAARARLARLIAQDLRRSNVGRISAQLNPDGSPFEPRKQRPALRSRTGRIKRRGKAMFQKLRKAQYFRAVGTADAATVGFTNPTVARVALVHQLGLRDRVSRRPGAPEVQYPARRLLGISDDDRQMVLERVLEHISS